MLHTRTLTSRENYLRAVEFRGPEWIPIKFSLGTAAWLKHGRALEEIVLRYPLIFEGYEQGSYVGLGEEPFATAGEYVRDDWGCLWHNTHPGVLGQVVEHPLADWHALASFRPPDPAQQWDWSAVREEVRRTQQAGRVARRGSDVLRGGFFDRLQFLRGLENLLTDLVTEPPELDMLIEMVLDYNLKLIRLLLATGLDVVSHHGDIATQRGLLMSPATFRKQLKPAYRAMFSLCRQNGVHVHYSCDGRLLDVVDDLIECGVTSHDPQVRANTLAGIAQVYKGKMCAMVDIDEQMLPFCSPEDIRQQVREIVDMIGSPAGGLMLYASPSEDVPLENIEAICQAWEEFGQ